MLSQSQAKTPAAGQPATRRAYVAPALSTHGSVETLTQHHKSAEGPCSQVSWGGKGGEGDILKWFGF